MNHIYLSKHDVKTILSRLHSSPVDDSDTIGPLC